MLRICIMYSTSGLIELGHEKSFCIRLQYERFLQFLHSKVVKPIVESLYVAIVFFVFNLS
jgi:hypothetical protein